VGAVALALWMVGCKPVVVVWTPDHRNSIGEHVTEVVGAPRLVPDGARQALCFDGERDALFVHVNPLEGWREFTVQVLFKPDGTGKEEQRFLHVEDDQQHRLLIETRVNPDRSWSLDTFLRKDDDNKLTLLDRRQSQPADQWYWAALVYDGMTMRHFVNGEKQLEGRVSFPKMSAGKVSLGVRQNKVHWFKGCIAEVRFSPSAIQAQALQRP
jgi:hypothetical protein